jgi:hypothetical protein
VEVQQLDWMDYQLDELPKVDLVIAAGIQGIKITYFCKKMI